MRVPATKGFFLEDEEEAEYGKKSKDPAKQLRP